MLVQNLMILILGYKTNSSLKYSHSVILVKSSFVGPNPPVIISISDVFLSLEIESIIAFLLSEIDNISITSTPILFKDLEIYTELVLTI